MGFLSVLNKAIFSFWRNKREIVSCRETQILQRRNNMLSAFPKVFWVPELQTAFSLAHEASQCNELFTSEVVKRSMGDKTRSYLTSFHPPSFAYLYCMIGFKYNIDLASKKFSIGHCEWLVSNKSTWPVMSVQMDAVLRNI